MLAVPATLALYLLATRCRSTPRVVACGLLAGGAFSGALALKLLALPAILGFGAFHWLFSRGAPRRVKTIALGALLLGPARRPPSSAAAARSPRGAVCSFRTSRPLTSSSATTAGSGESVWRSPDGQRLFRYSSPSAHQRTPSRSRSRSRSRTAPATSTRLEMDPPITDRGSGLSVEHVYDLFIGSLPWPSFEPILGRRRRGSLPLHRLRALARALLCVDSIRARVSGGSSRRGDARALAHLGGHRRCVHRDRRTTLPSPFDGYSSRRHPVLSELREG